MFGFLMSFLTYSQENESIPEYLKLTETDSVYLKAMEKYIIEIDSFYNKYSQNKQPKQIYIQYENYLSKLPNRINGYEIIKLGLANRQEYFRKNKNRLRLVEIAPLTIKDGRFQIILTPYFAKLKSKKKLDLALSDWTIVFFEFKNGKLIHAETENGGI
ncbi:MAG: hypothetical protein COA50_16525 [Flavobacteriaceae bacterium]|nr:MAG: hypothetical protein COA50_16525 [Flavobacteriaceae bacterium]